MSKYDWSNVPEDVAYIATNKSTGTAQGYIKEPAQGFDTWESKSRVYWLHLKGYVGNWEDSLEKRP